MLVSIIIPTFPKNKKYLDVCVKSIEEHTTFDYEIIIAENGEGTEFAQGQCAAVNRAVYKSTGEYLLISNDDMYYPDEWDKNIVFAHDCFCPNLVEPINNAGSAPPFLKLDAGLTLDEFYPVKVDEFMYDHKDQIVENGFNFPLFIKTKLFMDIGKYDENYDPWGSNGDSDLQYKIEIAGVIPKRLRGVLVYHFSNKSGTFEPEQQAYWQRNYDYFTEKWGFQREDTVWEHNLHIPLNRLKYKPDWSIYE